MKSIYLLSFFLIVSIIIIISLYFTEIPSPSVAVSEEFTIEIK